MLDIEILYQNARENFIGLENLKKAEVAFLFFLF